MRNRFALWLQGIGQRLIEYGERLYVSPLPQNSGLSDLVLATLRNRSGKLAENVIRNNALLMRLGERDHG